MEATIFIAMLVAFTIGWAAASYENRKNKNDINSDLYNRAYDEGWEAALQNPEAVKHANQYYFQNRP